VTFAISAAFGGYGLGLAKIKPDQTKSNHRAMHLIPLIPTKFAMSTGPRGMRCIALSNQIKPAGQMVQSSKCQGALEGKWPVVDIETGRRKAVWSNPVKPVGCRFDKIYDYLERDTYVTLDFVGGLRFQ
jgi:hypothetical protein